MIHETIKKIKENIRTQMKAAGFKTEGLRYIRITKRQVLQIFGFQGSSGGDCFTVNIGVTPLFSRKAEDIKNFSCFLRIGHFLKQGDKWWPYTGESESEVTAILLEKLLPFLDECGTYDGFFRYCGNLINSQLDEENSNNDNNILLCSIASADIFGICVRYDRKDYITSYVNSRTRDFREGAEMNSKAFDELLAKPELSANRDFYLEQRERALRDFETKITGLKQQAETFLSKTPDEIRQLQDEITEANCELLKKYIT